MSEIINKNEVEKQIASLRNKISYLKSKRTKICLRCGKEFIPVNSMKEIYCSDVCRKLVIKESKHKNYLKNRENPEYLKKMKEYRQAWLVKNGKLKPKSEYKPETISLEEYNKLKELYNVLVDTYNNLNMRCNEIIKENQMLIVENHQLRNKTFIQKLKDLF